MFINYSRRLRYINAAVCYAFHAYIDTSTPTLMLSASYLFEYSFILIDTCI